MGETGTSTELSGTPRAADWRSYPSPILPTILKAALVEFQQHGYHGTTVRNIATGAGLTMPALYYHYGNKEGILFALLEIALDDFQVQSEMCLEEAGGDPRVGFENYITVLALHNSNRRDLASLHAESRFLGPELRARYLSRRANVENTLEKLLAAGVSDGIFDPSDTRFTARQLLGMTNGILDWYSPGGPLSALEIAERYRQAAVRMVAKV
ncbi:TetR/AcrR family transcriptional regulator [Arthrobacter sp. Z4-13]